MPILAFKDQTGMNWTTGTLIEPKEHKRGIQSGRLAVRCALLFRAPILSMRAGHADMDRPPGVEISACGGAEVSNATGGTRCPCHFVDRWVMFCYRESVWCGSTQSGTEAVTIVVTRGRTILHDDPDPAKLDQQRPRVSDQPNHGDEAQRTS